MIDTFKKNICSKAVNFYNQNGYLVIENFFSTKTTSKIKIAIDEIKGDKSIELYYDKSGLIRRMENFTYKHKTFKFVDEKIKNLLLKLTSFEQSLFKDKVNFKPPKGEGFFAHYDGIFQFRTPEGKIKNGWYEYTSDFTNCLICLDNFTIENGTLEISKSHNEDFKTLLKNTKNNGTPNIKDELILQLKFNPIVANSGSVVIFKHTCPHRSSPNYSKNDRGSLYLTYNKLKNGNFYKKYFLDKKKSKNPFKALQGEQI